MIRCTCRPPKRHADCAYCGYGGPCTHVCGDCRENGIDGPVIRGTERRTCASHRPKGRPKTMRQIILAERRRSQ